MVGDFKIDILDKFYNVLLNPQRVLVICILVSWIQLVSGQQKVWRDYGINDGLPGNTVYDMLQDSRGFMWFVTDRGICRFNGYEFESPVDTSAHAGTETYLPTEDIQGRIWFARLDNSIWFIERDTIRAWPHNKVLRQTLKSTAIIDQMGIEENGTIWLGVNSRGFLVIDLRGNYEVIRGSDQYNLAVSKIRNKVIYTRQGRDTTKIKSFNGLVDIMMLKEKSLQRITQLTNQIYTSSFYLSGAWPIKDDGLIAFVDSRYLVFQHDLITQGVSSDIIAEKVIQTQDGGLLLGSHVNPEAGLHYFSSINHFTQGKGKNLLSNYLVTDVFEDQFGGWWVATKNSGILYCKNPELEIYDEQSGLPEEEVICLADDGKNTIYAGFPKSGIFKIQIEESEIQDLGKPDRGMDLMSLFFDKGRNQLWSSTPLVQWIGTGWKLFPNTIAKDISIDPTGNILWMGSTFGFSSLDLATNNMIDYRMQDDPSTSRRTYTVSKDYEGRLWVATDDRLRIWNTDHYEAPPFQHEALKYPVRDIELLGDTSIAFAFLGGGILIMERSGDVTQLTKQSGLCSDHISKLKADTDGRLYACSSEGFSQLTPHDETWNIKSFDTRQGLPSKLINDITVISDQIWVATDKGLVRLNNSSATFSMPAPILNTFLVDNKEVPYQEAIRLPYHKNDISFHFYSLHFGSEGEIMYRYRLNSGDTLFQTTTSREVYFPELAPGEYEFEVQALGENGDWSKPSKWSFRILFPWWQKWWFILGMLGVIAVITRAIIISRIKAYHEKAEASLKIKDLELAALRAQINPHFIFNCLGSIQQFIAENDKDSATRYLARFAKLVRLSLHSSVDGKHSLKDEMEMLDSYLALEQMRFKGKFAYSITASADLDAEEIFLPTLLVQPFIENSVKHGIRNQSGEGKIDVGFTKEQRMLRITITDNGPGFITSHTHEDPLHKSVGMTLTRHRLELLSGNVDGRTYTQENLTGPDNDVLGSKVTILIPVD